jgi:hypothetical protein
MVKASGGSAIVSFKGCNACEAAQATGNSSSSYKEKNKLRLSIIISDVKPTTTISGNKFQETDCNNNNNNKNNPKKKLGLRGVEEMWCMSMEKSREREKKSTIISRDATLGKAGAASSSSRERGKNTSGDSPSSSATASKTKKKKKQYVNPSLVCTPWPEDLSMRSMGKREKRQRRRRRRRRRKEGRKEGRGVVD